MPEGNRSLYCVNSTWQIPPPPVRASTCFVWPFTTLPSLPCTQQSMGSQMQMQGSVWDLEGLELYWPPCHLCRQPLVSWSRSHLRHSQTVRTSSRAEETWPHRRHLSDVEAWGQCLHVSLHASSWEPSQNLLPCLDGYLRTDRSAERSTQDH